MVMVRPVTDDDIGLKVLRDAPPDAAEVIDIVAIHGIGAHPDDSWCKNVGTKEDPRWVNWLTEEIMLPAIAPNTRIMRYGYHSQWFGEGAIRQKVSTVAQRLLLALRRNRKECLYRPLLFIAHCFGGLVVLKALLDALHDGSEWPGLFESTIGLIFFGTPFRGAGGMSQIELLIAARQQYQEDEVQFEVLKILQPGNEFLQELVDQFGKTRRLVNKAEIACFYELKISDVGEIVGKKNIMKFVVDEDSGCLGLSEGVSKFPLSRTHFDMNKFGKPTEEDFEILCEVIKSMISISQRSCLGLSQKGLDARSTSKPVDTSPSGTSISKGLQGLKCETILSDHTRTSQKPKRKKKNVLAPKMVETWSQTEDAKLLSVVQAMSVPNWKLVAQSFENRSPFACQKRFEKLKF